MKENTKAIMSLAKIIENFLNKIYKNDNQIRNSSFADLITHAKAQNLIKKDEFHFLNGLRQIRNEEAHEVGVKKDKNLISSSLLVGFLIIFKLSETVKKCISNIYSDTNEK